MAIAEDDIQRVRAATSLSDLVSPYTQLRRSGRSQIGLCPFHSERTGSFSVNDETGRYMCFGCGAKGDVFNFVQQTEHLDFIAAVERLAGKAGIELHYTSGPDTGQRKHRKDRHPCADRGKDRATRELHRTQRGLDPAPGRGPERGDRDQDGQHDAAKGTAARRRLLPHD